MTCRLVVWILFIATLAGVAQAMLPPDAKAREPQLRAYYQQVREDYEVKQAELQVERAQIRERAPADIFTPPWLRDGTQTGVLRSGNDLVSAEAKNARQKKRRILISTLLLILIGAAAGWARYATREIDTK